MNNRERFLAANPHCIFCGGTTLATTIEHCPPRALFQHKHWPEGFEFAACEACNHGTRDQDAIVAMLARMDPEEAVGNNDGRVPGLIKNVGAQFPQMFTKILPSAIEARRKNRELGLQPGPGQTHQDVAPIFIPAEMSLAVETFSRKLAKAIYFREVGAIFSNEGTLLLNWFTNAELVQHGRYVLFDLLKDVPGRAVPLRRGGKYLDDQFQYKLSITPENHVFILQARFGVAFGLVIFGSTQRQVIEPVVEKLRAKYGKDGPFVMLQSAASSAA
jgi:hypothetical protein